MQIAIWLFWAMAVVDVAGPVVCLIWAFIELRKADDKRAMVQAALDGASIVADERAATITKLRKELAGAKAKASEDEAKVAEQQSEVERLQHIELQKDKVFELVMSIERQRDEWRMTFRTSADKHVAAVAVYDRELSRTRDWLRHALSYINKLREKDGDKPIKTPADFEREISHEAPPAGLVKEYVEEVKALFERGHPDFIRERSGAPRPPDIDGAAERDRILDELERGEAE